MAQKFFVIPLKKVPLQTKPVGYEVWFPSWSRECPTDIPETIRDKLDLFALGATTGPLPDGAVELDGEKDPPPPPSLLMLKPPPPSLLMLKRNCLVEYQKALEEWKALTQGAAEKPPKG